MDKIINNIGLVNILKIERRAEGMIGWERRNGFLGFEGELVIRQAEDGRTYACIENGRKGLTTSFGELTVKGDEVIFETANSVYTFRVQRISKTA